MASVSVDDIRRIAEQVVADTAVTVEIGTVATVSGDSGNGHFVTLKLGGSDVATEPVRCLRQYSSPSAGHRVLLLQRGGRPLYVLGQVN